MVVMDKKNIRLLILDRDGVINEDSVNYIRTPEEWVPIPGSLEAIATCNRAGIKVVIATNQSGVGRGYYSEADLGAIHAKMHALLQACGGKVDGIYYCPHKPEDECQCRKPLPGLLQQISNDFPDEYQQAMFVGDSWRDWQAGVAGGVIPCLVKTGNGAQTWEQHGHEVPEGQIYADLAMLVEQGLQFPVVRDVLK